ncbi:zymogen granule membrane protein 16-like [Parambassis ranga]|uniref:Zymogen granule membrane protein 16-like n=1 Tax=Parambassis ranga TaxID=210632 RepID=A0A6P7K865_9TELE|nr:zymogen granule membrane protein 16-like [Parambassis ranga]
MHHAVFFAALVACAFADSKPQFYSFSPSVGSGYGTSYTITGEGRITGIRIWEAYSNFIYGIQLRYGAIWSPVVGSQSGEVIEMQLFDDEAIVQISGKYAHYIQSLVFATNTGRSLRAGQEAGYSFNMYATHKKAELRFISGRVQGALTALEAHWAVLD